MNIKKLAVPVGILLAILIVSAVISVVFNSTRPVMVASHATETGNTWYWGLVILLVALAVGASFLKKGGGIAKVFIITSLIFLIIFGQKTPEVLVKAQENAAHAALSEAPLVDASPVAAEQESGHVATQGLATWEETKDGALPVGVWSEPVSMEPGCTARYPGGYGIVYIAQYRFYDHDWRDQEIGSSPKMNGFRFKLLRAGTTELRYSLICS